MSAKWGVIWGQHRGVGINSDMENIDLFLLHRLVTHVCLLVLFHPLWSFYNWWVYSQCIQERLTDGSKRPPGTDIVHCSFFMESFSKSVFYAVLHTRALFLFLHFHCIFYKSHLTSLLPTKLNNLFFIPTELCLWVLWTESWHLVSAIYVLLNLDLSVY